MYLDTRKNKKGQLRFRFTYLDHLGNRLRYPAADTPDFKTREEAEKWARSQSAAMGAKKAFIEKKLEWKTKHYQFNESSLSTSPHGPIYSLTLQSS